MVLAGGRGTRFWPKSRRHRPKQCLAILGDRTLVQETVARLSPLVETERIWVVTAADHHEAIREQLPQVPAEQILVEPVGRNTAPAIGLAAHRIAAADPEATMLVLPADHFVHDGRAFRDVLARAAAVAASGEVLVTIGVEPRAPETGYGYIERGEPLGDRTYRVNRFTEKPDRARAEEFLASGRYLWNSGIFAWRAGAILAAIDRFLPHTAARLREVVSSWGDADAAARQYAAIEEQSVDYGILEKAQNVVVVSGEFGWDDVGSWGALARLLPADAEGNVLQGRTIAIDSRRNVVVAEGRAVGLVGVEDLVVVETADALLVCARDRVQEVRRLLEEIGRRGWRELL